MVSASCRTGGGSMWKVVLGMMLVAGCVGAPLPTRLGTELGTQLPADRTVAEPAPPASRRFTQGEALYIRHCASCHGVAARGDGPLAKALEIQPRNLRRADLFTRYTEAELVGRILHGKTLPVPLDP